MAPRGFCIGLALAAAATSVPVTDAQFLRGVFATSSSSSSYFSSSTWTLGQDGEMHEKVKKMSSEVMDTPNGPQRIEKKMVCKDATAGHGAFDGAGSQHPAAGRRGRRSALASARQHPAAGRRGRR
eukprot:CAMPEP_0115363680 /NCGR_PEP_ID=MMETSP0270-20121206/103369_1 /TAXON_ID=71861 /ORGANISM="Scrippsiella trochoidea, Strain CCMP3099" /LENGTH=125 /DNA_ID=CAMNT_0002786337 /DNA_START=183 /DNA_END=557 /DNA_ORIENTATION=-